MAYKLGFGASTYLELLCLRCQVRSWQRTDGRAAALSTATKVSAKAVAPFGFTSLTRMESSGSRGFHISEYLAGSFAEEV